MICRANVEDARRVAALANKMWAHDVEELAAEFAELAGRDDSAVFLALCAGMAIGFAQCQLRRDYVEGTDTSPVGYLEGVYVAPEYRGRGYARRLLSACEDWARQQGCTEFASDCELGNTASLKFHMSVGFDEANRIICFTKKL